MYQTSVDEMDKVLTLNLMKIDIVITICIT